MASQPVHAPVFQSKKTQKKQKKNNTGFGNGFSWVSRDRGGRQGVVLAQGAKYQTNLIFFFFLMHSTPWCLVCPVVKTTTFPRCTGQSVEWFDTVHAEGREHLLFILF